ncbi:MAG TPA: response regulator transcription factor [Chloroflexi bacterium]|nr:response regulator transcription factor [Chloroflexota bacterium]
MEKATKRILVIDDEPEIRRAVRLTITLQEPTWEVVEAPSGRAGLARLSEEDFDLVLLDLMMPEMSGYEVLEQIRLFSDVPVIILTVRDDELDKVHGLELGADDYIVKPFGHLELLARIRSLFRRIEGTTQAYEKPFVSGDLRIDYNTRTVTLKGKPVSLTRTEYRLLEILARNAGKIVPTRTLTAKIWGPLAEDNPEYLKVYIHRLRAKLGDDPRSPLYLHTERGVGYWLTPPARPQKSKE